VFLSLSALPAAAQVAPPDMPMAIPPNSIDIANPNTVNPGR
jgi:hypothetical protein